MKKATIQLAIALLVSCGQSIAGGWGPTFAIEISGGDLKEPIQITDPSVLEQLSFWVGPGTGMSDLLTDPQPKKSIVDWDAGVVTTSPSGEQQFEVKFLVGSWESPAAFRVLYVMDQINATGYIYYPHGNSIVTHRSEGTWRYASDRWNRTVGSVLRESTVAEADRER